MRELALWLVVLATGCTAGHPMPLLDAYALAPVDAADDPMLAHRPAVVDCPAAAWGVEGGGFEVQTGVCDYAAFGQALSDVPDPGDVLAISIWHDALDAAEPATGHVAVALGATVVWEAEVAIPAVSGVLEADVVVPAGIVPDATLGLHLHNHGFNSWRFVAIDRYPR